MKTFIVTALAILCTAATYGGASQRLQGSFPAAQAQNATTATNAINVIAGGNVVTNAVNANNVTATTVAAGQGNVVLSQDGNGSVALTDNGNVMFWCNPNGCAVMTTKLFLPTGGDQYKNGTVVQDTANGTLQVLNTAGTSGVLIIGPTTTSGFRLFSSGTSALTLQDGAGGAANLTIGGAYNSTIPAGFVAYRLNGTSTYGMGASDATHLNLYTNGTNALSIDANQVSTFSNNVIAQSSSATVPSLTLANSTAGQGLKLSMTGAGGHAQITTDSGGALIIDAYGFKSTGALGFAAGTLGTAASPIFTNYTSGNSGMYFPTTTTLGFSTNGVSALSIDSSQNANFAQPIIVGNGNAVGAKYDQYGNGIPTGINTESYYAVEEFDKYTISAYINAGNAVGPSGSNSVNTTLATSNVQGMAYANTSSTVLGGFVSTVASLAPVKSATINYQWRAYFRTPTTASSSTNRYTVYIGGMVFTGASNTATPLGGPYIKYSDNVNSGNWVLGDAVNGTQTTTNASVAPTFATWNSLTITLANGVFTYVLNGTTLGTVTDANLATTVSLNQGACIGGVAIIPDGTNWTAAQYVAIDRADYYVTGLTR